MTTSSPKYSFVLPAYKGRFLKESIDSILAQSYTDFEIVHNAIGFNIDKLNAEDGSAYVQWTNDWGTMFFQHNVEVME